MASSQLLFVLPSFSSKAFLKSSLLLVRVRPSRRSSGQSGARGGGSGGVRALGVRPEVGRGWGMPVPSPPPPQAGKSR